MKKPLKKWTLFALRWGIAVIGVWWVVSKINLHDQVLILDPQTSRPIAARVAELPPDRDNPSFVVVFDPASGEKVAKDWDVLYSEPDAKEVSLRKGDAVSQVKLAAVNLNRSQSQVQWFVVQHPDGHYERVPWFSPHGPDAMGADGIPRGVEGYKFQLKRPRIQIGVLTMLSEARPSYLWLSLLIFPITFIITSYRWHELLKALDIQIATTRTFVLNMVGAFYNTFLPGSTGGDVLKAYYASKQTVHRTRAVMSVFVDRVIGLLALVVLGGGMAAYECFAIANADDPVARLCLHIAIASGLIMLGTGAGLVVFFVPVLRKMSGLAWLIRHMPKQKQVNNAVTVMEIYRSRALLVFWSFLVTVPVHATVALSAMLACKAFGLPIPAPYYFVIVPVIVLAGSIPISPQGAGVMEFFAIKLTQNQVNVGQALVLTMSIRLVQIFWNLSGGLFVLRGGFHAPSDAERAESDRGDVDQPSADPGPPPLPSPVVPPYN